MDKRLNMSTTVGNRIAAATAAAPSAIEITGTRIRSLA